MKTFRLFGTIHLGGVSSWSKLGASFEFEATPVFRFDPVAEGLASIKLVELRKTHRFTVRLGYEWQPSNGIDKLKCLCSLFGLCLIYESAAVFGPSGADIRKEIWACLWRELMHDKGYFGNGDHRFVVFREPDTPIPGFLGKTALGKFPSRAAFGSFLSRSADDLGMVLRDSPTEDQITTFLYEASHNSHEHGRLGRNDEGLRGFRGIIGSTFVQSDLLGGDGFPVLHSALRNYAQRLTSAERKSVLLLSYTVTDFGQGIQHTLPSASPEESGTERLVRAFRPGQTRKAKGSATSVGEGLDKVLEACKAVKAFVCVHSGGLITFADFSAQVEGTFEETLRKGIQPSAVDIGTAITVIWPKQANPDQLTLL